MRNPVMRSYIFVKVARSTLRSAPPLPENQRRMLAPPG